MPDRIYALTDPRTEQVRYIGKTSHALDWRLKKHIAAARTRKGTYLLHWLRQLQDEGLSPDIQLLTMVAKVRWQETERAWIAFGRERGWPLTNSTEGGEGLCDPAPYVRRKLAEAAEGNTYASGRRSQAFRQRAAQIARQTRNALGHEVSEETRQGISEKLKEFFANGGEAVKGEQNGQSKLTAEQVREIRDKYAKGGVSIRGLAREYPVSYSAIRNILHCKAWRHIE